MKRPARVRIDKLLVDKGLIESREKAARQILAGEVFVDGQLVDKASVLVVPGAAVEVRARSPFVSRGGEQLVHALDHFQSCACPGATIFARSALRSTYRQRVRKCESS